MGLFRRRNVVPGGERVLFAFGCMEWFLYVNMFRIAIRFVPRLELDMCACDCYCFRRYPRGVRWQSHGVWTLVRHMICLAGPRAVFPIVFGCVAVRTSNAVVPGPDRGPFQVILQGCLTTTCYKEVSHNSVENGSNIFYMDCVYFRF